MGRLLKLLAALLAATVILILAAVIILPRVIDPNDYKDDIVAAAKEATGRDLRIDGDIDLSVFPWLGLELGHIELSNAEGFGDQPFVAVDRAEVKVKLLPLLRQRVEVDTLVLDALQLNLARAKDGSTNMDDLMAENKTQSEQEQVSGPGDGHEAESHLAGLAVGGISITNAQLSWRDDTSGQQFKIDQFNVKTGALTLGQPVELELSFQLESQTPPLRAELKLNANPNMDLEAGRITIGELALSLNATGEVVAGERLSARLKAAVATDLGGKQLAVDDLRLNVGGLLLTGALKGRNLADAPAFEGRLQLAELDLRQWLGSLGVAIPPTADTTALTRLAMKVDLEGSADSLDLNPLALTLDDTHLNGNLKVADLTAAMPSVRFELALDTIDLDRYLPPANEAAEQPATPAQASTAETEQELLPVEILRQLDIDGKLSVESLRVKKLLAEKATLTIQAKNGQISVRKQINEFYQGALQGAVDIDAKQSPPRVTIEENLSQLQAGPLLQDLLGKDWVLGQGNFQAKLQTRGNSDATLRRHLNGDLSFRFKDGAVKGISVAQMIRGAIARRNKETLPSTDEPEQTDLSELQASATIKNGVLTNNDLSAKSPFLELEGKGDINLVEESVAYTLKATIIGTQEGEGGALEEFKGRPIPIRFSGTFSDLKSGINPVELLIGPQKERLQQKKEELQGKFQGKLKGIGQKLQERLQQRSR